MTSPEFNNIIKRYQPFIKQIDKIILEFAQGKSSLISEIANHLIKSGGKRIRPLILLISANLCGKKIDERILSLAAAVEMIHSATLLHDDVVDNSKMRRGNETANAIWDNKASILVGDYVFSIAFRLMVKSKNLEALELLAKTSSIMADGEVMQLENSHDLEISMKKYLDIIIGKTAILFSAAAGVPALIDSKDKKKFLALQDFGKNLGIAFQMADDILDYAAKNQNLGKKIGDDFFEGKVTIPLINLYHALNDKEKILINHFHQKNIMQQGSKAEFEQTLALIKQYKILEQSTNIAQKYQAKALKNLEIFDDSPEKEELITILNYSLSRIIT